MSRPAAFCGAAARPGPEAGPQAARPGAKEKARRTRAGKRAAPASLPLHRPHCVADERPPLHGAELLGGGATQALPAPARRQHGRHCCSGGPGAAAPAAGFHLHSAPRLLCFSPLKQQEPRARPLYLRETSAIRRIQLLLARLTPAGTGPYSSPTPRHARPRIRVRAQAAPQHTPTPRSGRPPAQRTPVTGT